MTDRTKERLAWMLAAALAVVIGIAAGEFVMRALINSAATVEQSQREVR
jgi:uncharacterized membrane-anchored protein YhcB (DUF1043 family)